MDNSDHSSSDEVDIIGEFAKGYNNEEQDNIDVIEE